jgi:ribonuclease J
MNFLNDKDNLYFIPMGGAEQFGVNLNVYSFSGKLLLIDCGMGFADERFPNVDILLPDPKFLEQYADRITGLVITHAHEDHIGAVAHLWPRLQCPIYCTKFTANVLQAKLNENPLCRDARINIVSFTQTVHLGPFNVQFVPVSHSVPETSALIIETKAGRVVHSGDWNLDPAPAIGKPTDPAPFTAAGEKGVIAYIGDSTNAEVEGVSGSEADVARGLEAVFKECNGRIAITLFASNVGRIRSVMEAARATGRKVTVIGRSLHRMIAAADESNYLHGLPDFVSEEDIERLPADKVVMIVTGSQGEARAQLARIARGDHQYIKLGRGDTVIFSSRAIPGNEKSIIDVKNNLAATGVNIVDHRKTPHCIHISGHPARDEITQMLQWVKPMAVIPVHGERTMLEAHGELARACQVKNVVIPNNGSVIRLSAQGAEIVDHIETGLLAVEPGRIIDVSHPAIGERRKLQFSGAVHLTLVMDKRGNLMAEPVLTTVGLTDQKGEEGNDFENDLLDEIEDILADMKKADLQDDHFVAEEVRIGLRRYVDHLLRLKPKATVHVVRV